MSGAVAIIVLAAIQHAKRERERREREQQEYEERKRREHEETKVVTPRRSGMYCRNCTKRIDGTMSMRVENDHVAFYHPECFPADPPSPVSEETQKAIAKSLIALAKLLGGFSDEKLY